MGGGVRRHDSAPVAIIGGGLAGLVAARELTRRDIPTILYEASDSLGGLARTVRDENGFSFDFGAHFITNRLAAELGAGDLCVTVPRYGEAVVTADGTTYHYPMGFVRNPRFVADLLRARLVRDRPASNAVEEMATSYGSAMANEIAGPILEGWSGLDPRLLSPAVVEKLDEGVLKTLWLKTAGWATRRAVAVGYTREVPSSAKVWHVYPREGVGSLIGRLASTLNEDVIRLSSPVQRIHVEDETVRGVTVNGETQEVAAAMSTAPVHVLPKLVEGTDSLDYLARFRYRPMVFVNLLLEGRGLIPDVVVWYTDRRLPFFRLTETPLSMPWIAPQGKTTLMADICADVGDEIWTADDADLADLVLDGLSETIPDVRHRFLGVRVLRTPLAYPLFLNEYEADRRRFSRGTGISGLYSIGRNGEFAHILMEDVYWRTKAKVRLLTADLAVTSTRV
ncbi:MAG: FAD-dependent oxidoreductase [Actinobacteria bacterium]|nr:FAD-dependent oxidoreductase [Actinomycetota bacterium]